jgi:hypothetical protein
MMMKSMKMRGAGHKRLMREIRNEYKMLVRKPEWKRQLGRPRRKWKYNIKLNLREIGIVGYGMNLCCLG